MLGGNGPLTSGGGPALRGFPGVGVDPRREPHVAAQTDESLGLGGGEQTVLDGDVVELGDALLNHRRKHLGGDEIGVGLSGRWAAVARPDVPWHDVSPKKCDDESQRRQLAGVFEQAQLPQLLLHS